MYIYIYIEERVKHQCMMENKFGQKFLHKKTTKRRPVFKPKQHIVDARAHNCKYKFLLIRINQNFSVLYLYRYRHANMLS